MACSSSNKSCLYCRDSSSGCFSNGWKLKNGDYAQLCNRCFSAFNLGIFCETNHSAEDGWRSCVSCGKLVHCGCIISLDKYLLLDVNGIICMDCSRTKCSSSESALIPLFEKIVTAWDSNPRRGRIVIPRKHAEAHFPEVADPDLGIPLTVMDTEGIEWYLLLSYWHHLGNRMFILKKLGKFIKMKKMQAGDTVAFYARKSNGKIVMELKKSH